MNASAKVVRSLAIRNRFWFGMMMRVSTTFCSSAIPASARRMRLVPSNWKGLVTTPTVSTPSSRAARAMTGAAPVPVPPPMPAVMKHMCTPCRCSTMSSIDSSAAAPPTCGLAPAPSPWVTPMPSWMRLLQPFCCNAWASVFATTNSTPSSSFSIMLWTALPPAPPTPKTVMRGRSSVASGTIRFKEDIGSPVVCVDCCSNAPVFRLRYFLCLIGNKTYLTRDARSREKPLKIG